MRKTAMPCASAHAAAASASVGVCSRQPLPWHVMAKSLEGGIARTLESRIAGAEEARAEHYLEPPRVLRSELRVSAAKRS